MARCLPNVESPRWHLEDAVQTGDAVEIVRLAHYLISVHVWQAEVTAAKAVFEDARVAAAVQTLCERTTPRTRPSTPTSSWDGDGDGDGEARNVLMSFSVLRRNGMCMSHE